MARRSKQLFATGFANGKQREGFGLAHFSVQGNHLHLIVEAQNAVRLARGIQGLAIRLARGLNRLMQRRGKVFADRYYAHVLTTPREVAHALAYVLGNFVRHAASWGEKVVRTWIDPYSSAAVPRAATDLPTKELCAPARTWLLRVGWTRARVSVQPRGAAVRSDL
jgi:putative transposase